MGDDPSDSDELPAAEVERRASDAARRVTAAPKPGRDKEAGKAGAPPKARKPAAKRP